MGYFANRNKGEKSVGTIENKIQEWGPHLKGFKRNSLNMLGISQYKE